MNFKKLERVTKIYEEIKLLDKEIIEIDKFAMLVANGEIKSSFELKIKDLGKKKENEEKVSFDEDGSLIKGSESSGLRFTWRIISPFGCTTEKKEENEYTNILKNELSDNATMAILGVLLHEKQFKRSSLLTQLQKIGVVA